MKKLIYIVVIAFLAACGGQVEETGSTEEIKQQISEYKSQISDLSAKINELEKQLEADDPNAQAIPVNVKKITPETFRHFVDVNGTVEAINSAYISPEMNGQVKKIHVTEGQRVSKGTLLISINGDITKSSIKEVETSLDLAKTVYERQKELWSKKIGSEMDYLQAKNNVESLESRLETLQAQLDLSEVKAPIDGIVDEIIVKEGEMAIPGMMMIQLVNLSEIYVNADVSEAYVDKVKRGDIVNLEFPSYENIFMDVPIFRTGNIIKEANRTFKVQLKINNPGNAVKPNALARIKINDYSMENALLVPSIIVKEDMTGEYLYVVDSDGSAVKTYVKTGKSYNNQTIISEGIIAGDKVVTGGYNQISNGSKVKIEG